MTRIGAVAVTLFVLLAGCTSDQPADPTETPEAPIDAVIPQGNAHNHTDPAQHLLRVNAHLVDHVALTDLGPTGDLLVGAHAVASRGDLLAVAVNAGEEEGGQQGFHLFSLADPQHPEHLAFWDAGVRVNGDRTIALSQDGNTVFLGYEGENNGVAAIDVSERSNPRQVAFWDDPQDFGSHTISTGTIDGVQYVYSLAVGVNILRFDGTTLTLVGKYVAADEPMFAAESTSSSTGSQAYAIRSLYGHDMTFFDDPVTGKPLLFVAYAYQGMKVLDLSVPNLPVLTARWQAPADTDHRHYVHGVSVERLDDGELLVVVGAETFEEENQAIASPLWILDATEAIASPLPLAVEPEHLGTWRNPGAIGAGNLLLSAHFTRLSGGLLYASHYHGGIWAIDLRTKEAQADPTAFGAILPVPDNAIVPPPDCCIGFDLAGVPMVFDVELGPEPGVVYGADLVQGLVTVKFDLPA